MAQLLAKAPEPPSRRLCNDFLAALVIAVALLFFFLFVVSGGTFGRGILLLCRRWTVARCVRRVCSGLCSEHRRGFTRVVLRFQIHFLLFQEVLLNGFRELDLLLFGVLL